MFPIQESVDVGKIPGTTCSGLHLFKNVVTALCSFDVACNLLIIQWDMHYCKAVIPKIGSLADPGFRVCQILQLQFEVSLVSSVLKKYPVTGWGGLSLNNVSTCQKDVKCQKAKYLNYGEVSQKKKNWHNEVHTYHQRRSPKLVKNTFYSNFEGFWPPSFIFWHPVPPP